MFMNKTNQVCVPDANKDKIFASVRKGKHQSKVKKFSTLSEGFEELRCWLHSELFFNNLRIYLCISLHIFIKI